MLRLAMLITLAMGCKDSGSSVEAPPATTPRKDDAPEPPGGPPSCGEVADHLAAGLDFKKEMHGNVKGADISISGDDMRLSAAKGVSQACRESAWDRDTRKCVLSWGGNMLRESSKLHAECPGTVAKNR